MNIRRWWCAVVRFVTRTDHPWERVILSSGVWGLIGGFTVWGDKCARCGEVK